SRLRLSVLRRPALPGRPESAQFRRLTLSPRASSFGSDLNELPHRHGPRRPATRSATSAVSTAVFLRGDVLQRLRFGERAQLLQALVLDLPDPLTRDVERPADLVERARVLAVQSVTKLEHTTLARRQAAEHALQRRLAQFHLGDLVGQRLVLV